MHDDHDHDRGLDFDLPRLISRRRALGVMLGGLGSAVVVACGGSASPETGGATATGDTIPDETAGPFPADGSNGPNILTESGVVRQDITQSVGDASGVAEGIPTTINLQLLDVAGGGGPLAGAAVYIWHCDREGRYSLYSQGATDQNYLRGVQEADGSGRVTFTSIFPASYSGRWPHIHFEVYPSLDEATKAGSPTVTSQLAFPEDTCTAVYAADGYEQSVRNLAQVSLERDMVFSDGVSQPLATMTGSADSGYVATLDVPV